MSPGGSVLVSPDTRNTEVSDESEAPAIFPAVGSGTTTSPSQRGHLISLPANSSLTGIFQPHSQATVMAMIYLLVNAPPA